MTQTPTPQWFSTAIREGLAMLYLLNLDGCPAADTVGATTAVWVERLWKSPRREWHMDADLPCIRESFGRIADNCNRWPAPAKFWEYLPERASFTGNVLPGRIFSLEERRENLRKLREIGERLLGDKAEDSAG